MSKYLWKLLDWKPFSVVFEIRDIWADFTGFYVWFLAVIHRFRTLFCIFFITVERFCENAINLVNSALPGVFCGKLHLWQHVWDLLWSVLLHAAAFLSFWQNLICIFLFKINRVISILSDPDWKITLVLTTNSSSTVLCLTKIFLHSFFRNSYPHSPWKIALSDGWFSTYSTEVILGSLYDPISPPSSHR